MARIRTIKPEFFRHEGLYEAERDTGLPLRVAFAGLWTAADREGRFRWRARQLKLDCLPYDDVDFSRVLDALNTRGFIVRYASDGAEYGCIPSWDKHQAINNREAASLLPPPPEKPDDSITATRVARVDHASSTRLDLAPVEGKGKEGKENGHASRRVTRSPSKPLMTALPDDFAISDRVRRWADGKGYTRLDARLEHFVSKAKAKGYSYADWDEAFMEAVRKDWADLNGSHEPVPGERKRAAM